MPAKKPVPIDRASIDARRAARIEYSTAPADALFDAEVGAVVLGKTSRTLEAWRRIGKGPTYLRIGRSVRYRKCDLDAWIARQGARQ